MNQDYYNYACRHLELLSGIMRQLDSLNTNMYNIYERPHVASRERGTRRNYESSLNSRSNSASASAGASASSNASSSSTNERIRNRMRTSRPYSSYRPSPITRPSQLQELNSNRPLQQPIPTTGNNELSNLANNILNSLFLEPVVVFPSPEQIENATSVIEYSELPEDSRHCPITLEPFTETTPLLRIDHCGHIFTRSGILRWFHNHVNCPVCRHDIRSIETTATNDNTSNTSIAGNTNNTNNVNDDTALNSTLQFDFILQPNITNSTAPLGNMTYLTNPVYTYYPNNTMNTMNTENNENTENSVNTMNSENIENTDYENQTNQIV